MEKKTEYERLLMLGGACHTAELSHRNTGRQKGRKGGRKRTNEAERLRKDCHVDLVWLPGAEEGRGVGGCGCLAQRGILPLNKTGAPCGGSWGT